MGQTEDASSDAVSLFLVRRSQEDVLFDHLTKFTSPTTQFTSPTTQFIVQIDVLVHEVMARSFNP